MGSTRRKGAVSEVSRSGTLVDESSICDTDSVFRRLLGFLLILLAVASVIPASTLLLLLASGATTGAQGHVNVVPLAAGLLLAIALFMGSRRLLSHHQHSRIEHASY
jgi:hypothetical protein